MATSHEVKQYLNRRRRVQRERAAARGAAPAEALAASRPMASRQTACDMEGASPARALLARFLGDLAAEATALKAQVRVDRGQRCVSEPPARFSAPRSSASGSGRRSRSPMYVQPVFAQHAADEKDVDEEVQEAGVDDQVVLDEEAHEEEEEAHPQRERADKILEGLADNVYGQRKARSEVDKYQKQSRFIVYLLRHNKARNIQGRTDTSDGEMWIVEDPTAFTQAACHFGRVMFLMVRVCRMFACHRARRKTWCASCAGRGSWTTSARKNETGSST